ANQLLTNVLKTQEDNYIDCYYLIANNYAHLGLLQDATKYAEMYIEKAPHGDFEEEATVLLDMLQIEDEDDWIFDEEDELIINQETAFYHLEREEWAEAIVILEEMITLFPEFQQARHEYHYALFFIGEKEKAIAMEEKYVKDHPDALFSYMNLAVFYAHEQNHEKMQYVVGLLDNIYPVHEQQKLRLAVTFAQVGL